MFGDVWKWAGSFRKSDKSIGIHDLLMIRLGQPRFTWGAADLTKARSARQRYIRALRAADKFDYALLRKFVRT